MDRFWQTRSELLTALRRHHTFVSHQRSFPSAHLHGSARARRAEQVSTASAQRVRVAFILKKTQTHLKFTTHLIIRGQFQYVHIA